MVYNTMATSSKKSSRRGRVIVPKAVQKEAQLAVHLRKVGFQGCTDVGHRRAKQLARGGTVSEKDFKQIAGFFARHRYVSRPGFMAWNKAGRPESETWAKRKSILAMLAWGGVAGEKWTKK